MKIEIMIPSFLAIVMIFSILINVGRSNYYEQKKEKFDLRQNFPYEMQDDWRFKYNWHVRFLALFLALALAMFGINAFNMTNASSLSFATGVMILNAIAIMLLFFTSMRSAYLHMALAIIHFGLTFLSYAFVANYVFFFNVEEYPTYLGVISAILVIFILALMINPKLYRWMYLEKEEKDGEVLLKRPKVMLLPLYEWAFMMLTIFLDLLITIVTLLM